MTNLNKLKEQFAKLKQGEKMTYYEGYILLDRSAEKGDILTQFQRDVALMADYFMELAYDRKAILAQRRSQPITHSEYGPFVHEYQATKI